MFTPGPSAQDVPKVDFSWLGNLPNAYAQGAQIGQQLRMQQPAQGDLSDPNNLIQQLNQRGGLGAVAPSLQNLWDMRMIQQPSWPIGRGQGLSDYGPAPTNMSDTGNRTDPRGKIPVILAAAQKYGVDPRYAVAAARAEGLGEFLGDGGKSGGAFQLYTGGGLGNEFHKETGLNPLDPNNEDATIDWAVKNLARTGWGPYNGAKKIGLTGFMGINRGNRVASADCRICPGDFR
jgi:hypothetical protein